MIQALLLYMTGLIVCEKKATSKKIADRVGYLSHDTLTRALIRGKQGLGKLSILFINFCLSQTTGYLIIDDVFIPKPHANRIEGVYNDFDHSLKEHTKGMRIVVIIWCNGSVRIPVAWAIWHKEKKERIGLTAKGKPRYKHTGECLLEINGQTMPYRTKNQIAVELLEHVLSRGLKAQYITFDNWYASSKNLQYIAQNRYAIELHCYSRLKNNRKVIYQGQEKSVEAIARLFPITSFNHKHGAYIKAIEIDLPGYGDIKLLLVRQDSHSEPGKTKYLFSTDIFASAPEILLRYRSRWAIETVFRDLKQNLNLGSCQATTLEAQKSHLALSLFAFVLLELLDLEFTEKKGCTIGGKKETLCQLSLFTNPERTRYSILDSSRPNLPLVPIENHSIAKVGLRLDFAYKSLLFPNCQRAA